MTFLLYLESYLESSFTLAFRCGSLYVFRISFNAYQLHIFRMHINCIWLNASTHQGDEENPRTSYNLSHSHSLYTYFDVLSAHLVSKVLDYDHHIVEPRWERHSSQYRHHQSMKRLRLLSISITTFRSHYMPNTPCALLPRFGLE